MQLDSIILDEAQRIKNWNTKISRAVKSLNIRYRFVLTGTPLVCFLIQYSSALTS